MALTPLFPPFGRGFFEAWGISKDEILGRARDALPRPFILEMIPPGYPLEGCFPAEPASVSPG